MRLTSLRSLSALALGLSLLAPATPAQDSKQAQGDSSQVVEVVTDLDGLMALYQRSHGGAKKLQDLRTLSFQWVPVSVVDGEETDQAPLGVEVLYSGGNRMVRLEEEIGGRQIVKLSDGLNAQYWSDGKAISSPELLAMANSEARYLLSFLDLLYRPQSDDLVMVSQGKRTREGQDYAVVAFEFNPNRLLGTAFRSYYNSTTGLVDRIDTFDLETLQRLGSTYLSDYANHDGVKFPALFTFKSRDGRVLKKWRLEGVKLNPQLAPERFQAPGQ